MFRALLQGLASRPLVRRAVNYAMTCYGRSRARKLNIRPTERVQRQTLLKLVHKARDTRFGQDHRFERIRSVEDFQERVPLRDYEAHWEGYWREPFPYLQGATWPDPIPYFALSSGTTSGATKYLPLSRQLLASNQKAALTSVGLLLAAHPHTPIFTGKLFFLGGSTDLRDLSTLSPHPRRQRVLGGDLSGVTALEASFLLRPYSFPPPDLALIKDWEEKMRVLAQASVHEPITMISGIPAWMLVLFDRLRQATGKQRLIDIWPTLRVVIHGGTKFDPYRELFRQQIGSDLVHFLEVYPASEGFIATEDPHYRMLRLLTDHDIFFEFVPVDELDKDRPTRHTTADVVPGVNYAVVMSTCAGLWAYVLGDTVIFERNDPPLLRFSGRTKYFLSAFGEHLISEEVEKAVTRAAQATGCNVIDFHVGPVFPDDPSQPGKHRYFVEFAEGTPDLEHFAREVDAELCRINEDYEAHRVGDLAMVLPDIVPVRHGGFIDWMRARGKLGGQNKVPRMDNSGEITADLARFFAPAPG